MEHTSYGVQIARKSGKPVPRMAEEEDIERRRK